MDTTTLNRNKELLEQLEFHWRVALRPRLDGLTDDEYFWEPVPGCWSLRRRGQVTAPIAAGSGDWVMEFELPEPDPAPVTTIAWRIGHLLVGVFGMRVANHFGGPAVDYRVFDWPSTASDALEQLDTVAAAWFEGVRGLGEDGFAREVGPAEGPYEHHSYAALVLHINREAIHHGAEIALLRDLYRASAGEPLEGAA